MGRRALPKLNPNLEYSDYYGEIARLPDDWDVSSIFDSSIPLEVEMGSGKGLFMTTASGLHPERNYLGIEVRKKYAQSKGPSSIGKPSSRSSVDRKYSSTSVQK